MMEVLREDLKRGLEDEELTDVTFLVGYDSESVEIIRAASIILRLRSPVFYTNFLKRWAKSQPAVEEGGSVAKKNKMGLEDVGPVIEIPDVNPAAFRSFLKYLYTAELDICNIEDTVGVYYLGVKYHVGQGHLVHVCLQFLEENLSIYNVLGVLDQATMDLYKNLDKVQDLCLRYFSMVSEELIKSEQFTSIGLHVLQAIVQLDVAGVQETQLFSRVFAWGAAECQRQSVEVSHENIRRVLGPDVFYNIRFMSLLNSKLTSDLVGNIWGPNGMLTNEEQLSFLRLDKFGIGEVDNFNSKARQVRVCRAIKRLSAAEPLKESSGVGNHCTFIIYSPARLHGFGFFGSYSQPNAKYEFMIEVKNHTENTEASITCTKVCHEPGNIIRVFLEEPLPIVAAQRYTICYFMKGPPTFAGDGNPKTHIELKSFLKNNEDFIVGFPNANRNNSFNQLPFIYFGNM